MENGLSSLIQKFDDSEEITREARSLSERDRDYRDNIQWTQEEAATMRKRKQPVTTWNVIQRKVDYLSGLEKQMRKDPKAFPRNPDDEGAAEAATDAIRYVCEDSHWDETRSAAFDNIQVEGTGAIFVGHRETLRGIDPAIFQIPWDRFFYDPHSSRADFDDAMYMGIVTWYDFSVVVQKWGEAAESAITHSREREGFADTYDDKPSDKRWTDRDRKRIRVVEMYHRDGGVWHRSVFTKGGFLEETQPSPYLDEDGEPENPIKAHSYYIDRQNNRYGGVRAMISPQDEVNKRHSKSLHLITMRQARVSRSAEQDPEEVRRELAKPDGILIGEDEDFRILDHNDMASGNMQLLQHAIDFMSGLGPNAALAGKNENDMSGRAILAQQQGGMVEVARLFDCLRSLSLDVYRAIWNRIRQFWQAERWVRVTDNENHLRFVGLNQQVTVSQLAQEVAEGDESAIQKAAEIVGPSVMQAYMQGDQQAQMALGLFVQQYGDRVVETRNAVNELDVDIVIDEGMDTPTVQAEQFDMLAKMIGTAPQHKQEVIWEALFEASSLRNKEQIIEKFKEAQQADPMQAQMAQVMQQLQIAGAQAGVEKAQSETARNVAQAMTAGQGTNDPVEQQLRAQENVIDAYRADTERMEATRPQIAA